MTVSIFVPAHITGFFSIHNSQNPLKNGSTGAGFLLDKGVTTSIKHTTKDETSIKINGKVDKWNETIILKVLDLLHVDDNIKISQEIQVPVSAGFGSSAASALSIAIAISELLDLNHDTTKSGQIAHLAEVNLATGLGDVSAQLGKGMVIRKSPGAPGICEIESYTQDLYVGCKCFGKISTKSIIEDGEFKKIISSTGSAIQKDFMKNPTAKNFLDKSLEFCRKTNLLTGEVKTAVNDLKNRDVLGSSMAMLGNTVFAFSENKENLEGLEIYKINNTGIKI